MIDWRAKISIAVLGVAMGLLGGCATQPQEAPVEQGAKRPPDTYVVVRGDTLYAIAWRYGLDYHDIAAWNRLRNPDLIYSGQRLRLNPSAPLPELPRLSQPAQQPPSSRPAPEAAAPSKPAEAAPPGAPEAAEAPIAMSDQMERKVADLSWRWPTSGKVVRGFEPDIPGRKGIQIAGAVGQVVWAASPGQVVYSGSGLPGYGRLIIVKHSDTLLSAYGYLGRILVREGDSVRLGQAIAEMGTSSDNRPVLHFEIRQNGKPVDPLGFLPS